MELIFSKIIFNRKVGESQELNPQPLGKNLSVMMPFTPAFLLVQLEFYKSLVLLNMGFTMTQGLEPATFAPGYP